jgi:hypothetical protein
MAPTILPEFVRAGLAPVREALERERRPLTPREVQRVFYLCFLIADVMEKTWEAIQSTLGEGAEGGKLTSFLKETSAAVEEALRVYAKAREAAAACEAPANTTDLSRLEETARRAEQLRGDLASLLRWLEGAGPPRLEPGMLRGAGAAPPAEGYENIDSILARLRSGGDIRRRLVTGARPRGRARRGSPRGGVRKHRPPVGPFSPRRARTGRPTGSAHVREPAPGRVCPG